MKDMGESDPDKIQDETIREQVLYFKRGEGKKELTERIENRVIKAMEDGRKEGDRIRSKQIAYRMSSLGYTKKEIYDITGIDYK